MRKVFRPLVFPLLMSCVLARPLGGNVQSQASRQTFISPDRSFKISYPVSEKLFEVPQMETASELSYIPVCDSSAVICVAYPESTFEGTNFGAASFQVRQVQEAKNKTACETPPMISEGRGGPKYLAFTIPANESKRKISGVTFVHGVTGGAAMSHSMSTDLYRAFHRDKCYELSINITQSNIAAYEPGQKEFTLQDAQHLHRELEAILDSFKFLK